MPPTIRAVPSRSTLQPVAEGGNKTPPPIPSQDPDLESSPGQAIGLAAMRVSAPQASESSEQLISTATASSPKKEKKRGFRAALKRLVGLDKRSPHHPIPDVKDGGPGGIWVTREFSVTSEPAPVPPVPRSASYSATITSAATANRAENENTTTDATTTTTAEDSAFPFPSPQEATFEHAERAKAKAANKSGGANKEKGTAQLPQSASMVENRTWNPVWS